MKRIRDFVLKLYLASFLCVVSLSAFSLNAYAITEESTGVDDSSAMSSLRNSEKYISQDVRLSQSNSCSTIASADIGKVDSTSVIPSSNWVVSGGILTLSGEGIVGRSTLPDYQRKIIKKIVIQDGITEIKDDVFGAFYGFEGVETIELPLSLTYIGENAFMSCKSLVSIEVPDGVQEIGESAFQYCKALASVKLGSNVKLIGDYSFADCPSLAKFIFNEGLVSIGKYAFAQFGSNDGGAILSEVNLPNSLTSIGRSAFRSLKSLKTLSIAGSVEIGDSSFAFCNELETIAFGNAQSIGEYAFQKCISLKTVHINSDSIGSNAFRGCEALESVIVENAKTVGAGVFSDCDNLDTLEFTCPAPEILGSHVGANTCVIYPNNDSTWNDEVRKAIATDPNNMKVRNADRSVSDAPKVRYVSPFPTIEVPLGTEKTEIIDVADPFKIARSFDFDVPKNQSIRIAISSILPCYHAGFLYTIKNWSGEGIYWGSFSHKNDTELTESDYQEIKLQLEPGTYHVEAIYTQSHKGGGDGWFTVGVYEDDRMADGFPFRSGEVKTGTSNVNVVGHLGGSLTESDLISLWVTKLVSGEDYKAAVSGCSNRVLGVYSAVLTVNGATKHSDFGSIDLSFPIPGEYDGEQVKIHHLHMSDSPTSVFQIDRITGENVVVQNGRATISVEDLSLFVIEELVNNGSNNMGNATNNLNNGVGVDFSDSTQTATTNRTGTTVLLERTGISAMTEDVSTKTGLVRTGDVIGYGAALLVIVAAGIVVMMVRRRESVGSAAMSAPAVSIPAFAPHAPRMPSRSTPISGMFQQSSVVRSFSTESRASISIEPSVSLSPKTTCDVICSLDDIFKQSERSHR